MACNEWKEMRHLIKHGRINLETHRAKLNVAVISPGIRIWLGLFTRYVKK